MHRNRMGMVVAAVLIAAGTVLAGDWATVAKLSAGGGPKEIEVNRSVSKIAIKCTEGSVIINTVVVRQGGQTTPHRVASRINKGDTQQISIGTKLQVTGLRISDDSSGKYEVRVKD
ncbi:MAG: hypothetical protein H7A43_11440 [Verrucomicrobia bacterium]|nr:hypothetical protein [Kiritimatiellia bacterium]MCP5489248.1 hypothetical protein [Verrucomicrobiota bacterium]